MHLILVSRGEFAIIIDKLYEFSNDVNSKRTYVDLNKDSEYYTPVTNWLVFVGYPDGTFRPGTDITRAELASVCVMLPFEDGAQPI